jgi:hypothetical protein
MRLKEMSMSEQTIQKQQYTVSACESEETNGNLIFTFVPKALQRERGPGGIPKRVPQFVVAARPVAGGVAFDWSADTDDPGPAREEIEAEISARMKEREIWIDRIASLVVQVEQWAKEMGWSTRRIEKKLDDARIGTHRVPALLIQQDICRALLEPIGRTTPGAEGVVDLYLMPAYDDIASLYYYGDRWNVHYNTIRGTNAVVPAPRTESMPLSKDILGKVLAEMKQNAA